MLPRAVWHIWMLRIRVEVTLTWRAVRTQSNHERWSLHSRTGIAKRVVKSGGSLGIRFLLPSAKGIRRRPIPEPTNKTKHALARRLSAFVCVKQYVLG